ncbi:hypothetical protein O5483_17590, partial [Escherichia coli]|nr:hypothetical protein [Escherichia coli]
EWVHVQLHQQKGMISLSPPTICNSALLFCKDFENLTFCEGVNLWLQKRQRHYHFLTMKQQINLVSFSP